jgi:tetraacyldisaccharide 4'-kinase
VPYFNQNIENQINLKSTDILMFSGIAKADSFENYLEQNVRKVLTAWRFGDHHDFTTEEITKLLAEFDKYESENKILVSTEKDAMRLQTDEFKDLLKNYPIYYLPLQVAFFENDKEKFNQTILNYVEQNKRSY